MNRVEIELPPFVADIPPLAERRFRPRRPVFVPAVLASLDGTQRITCQVCNLSSRGAQIEVATFQPFPSEGYLIFRRDPVAFETAIVWTSPRCAGLNFRQQVLLNGAVGPKFEFLKELWKNDPGR